MQADKLKKGADHIKPKSGGKFTPIIYWKDDGETRYITFIEPISEFMTLDIHVVETVNGWRTFVCRDEAAFSDEEGECSLCAGGDKPARKTLALAAELEPVIERSNGRKSVTSLDVKMIEIEKEGETRSFPRIGVILQSPSNFFDWFKKYDLTQGAVDENSFEVIRSGKGGKTGYQIFPVNVPRPDLGAFEDEVPSLIDYIAELGSAAHYAEELGDSPPLEKRPIDDGPTDTSHRALPVDEGEGEVAEENDASFAALKARLEGKRK